MISFYIQVGSKVSLGNWDEYQLGYHDYISYSHDRPTY